jgi:hypothetical protein
MKQIRNIVWFVIQCWMIAAPIGVGIKIFMLQECWVAWGFRFFDGFSLIIAGLVMLVLTLRRSLNK